MNAIIFTSVTQATTTAAVIPTAALGGTTIANNGGYNVYVWSDAVIRVTGLNSSTSFSRLLANKFYCVGNAPNAARLTFASEAGTPDMRVMVTDGTFHGV